MKRHYIIPIFVPHQGCPHACVFCNQRSITGHSPLNMQEIRAMIERNLATFPKDREIHKEIAFYGGSFTGILPEEQTMLLELAAQYKKTGEVNGIRVSTRPDYITVDSLHLLKEYGVTTIEIGVQSLDDDVLLKSHRGHSVCDVVLAVDKIRLFDFLLGLQMMVGLPGDTCKKTLATASKIAGLHPDFVRIYPTVVIEDTQLARQYSQGMYIPLSLDEAVDRTASAMLIFEEAGIPVIRIGLQPTADLCSGQGIIAGPFHPAFRELVESRVAYRMLKYLIRQLPIKPRSLVVQVHPRHLSVALGQKKSNIMKLSAECGIGSIHIYSHDAVNRGDIVIYQADGKETDLKITKAAYAKLVKYSNTPWNV